MKSSRISALLMGSTMLLAGSVFAGPTNKKPLHIFENVSIDGKPLAPGDYKVEWNESGSDVQLNILRGKDTVATVPARVVAVPAGAFSDGYSTAAAEDGSKALTQIFFSGQKYELQIQSASASSASQAVAGHQN